MYTSFIVAFSVLILSVVGVEFPLNFPATINGTKGFDILTTQANLKTTATLAVETDFPLILCLHEYTIPVNSTQWNAKGCSIFVEIETNGTYSVALRNVQYKVALFVKDPKHIATVAVTLTGEICLEQAETVYDDVDEDCVKATELKPGVNIITLEAETPEFFYFDSGLLVGSIVIHEEDIGEMQSSASTVNFFVRRNGAPSENNHDFHGMSPVQINTPLVGRYFVRVNSTSHGQKNITLDVVTCVNGMGGPGCDIRINQTSLTQMQSSVLDTGFTYWQVNVSTTSNSLMWVSVRSVNGSAPTMPNIYASLGQLPTEDNADVYGCNQNACGAVNAIMVNSTGNQTWFVGVNGINGTEYGIWILSLCAPNCDDHGECTPVGQPNAGVCECVADFIGVDCARTNGLGAQYIVLIIIASLVVASAVIGFIAWAYMRRKRVDYEHVS
jgi:hypothetical protein